MQALRMVCLLGPGNPSLSSMGWDPAVGEDPNRNARLKCPSSSAVWNTAPQSILSYCTSFGGCRHLRWSRFEPMSTSCWQSQREQKDDTLTEQKKKSHCGKCSGALSLSDFSRWLLSLQLCGRGASGSWCSETDLWKQAFGPLGKGHLWLMSGSSANTHITHTCQLSVHPHNDRLSPDTVHTSLQNCQPVFFILFCKRHREITDRLVCLLHLQKRGQVKVIYIIFTTSGNISSDLVHLVSCGLWWTNSGWTFALFILGVQHNCYLPISHSWTLPLICSLVLFFLNH